LIYCNFLQENNTQNRIWPSLLQIYTQKILNKFISHFYEFSIHLYEIWNFKGIYGIFNRKKEKPATVAGRLLAHGVHAQRVARGRTLAGHRAQDDDGGAIYGV
jgi:hypothetical protein